MAENIKVCIALYSVAILQSIALMIYLLIKGRKTNTLYCLLVCQIVVLMWLFFGSFEETYRTIGQLWIYTKLAFFPVCFIGSCWLMFCMSYTGNKLFYNKYLIAFLAAIPLLSYLSLLTNEHHHLFIRSMEKGKPNEWGILFWLATLQVYSCLGTGIIMLAMYSWKQHKGLKKQFILLMAAVGIPLVVNALVLSQIVPSPGFDLTPASFSLTFTLVPIAIFKYRLLDIIPFALKEIVESMKEAVIIIDNCNNIVDFNRSFNAAFGRYVSINRQDNINTFIQKLRPFSNDAEKMAEFLCGGASGCFEDEISLAVSECISYFVHIRPISDRKNRVLGKIISFSNITPYKRLVSELDGKNAEITAANEELTAMNEELIALNGQLRDYSETVEELAVVRERNRFSKDAHDTLGHSMTILIALLEMAAASFEREPDAAKDKLKEAIKVSKDGLNELRRVISGLTPQKLAVESLVSSLKSLISNFTSSGMNVDFTVQGVDKFYSSLHSDTIYRLCQEALTNSLRHGKAQNVTIILQFNDNSLRLCIFDDGQGCKSIKKGLGISGMEERVGRVGGSIIYGSDGKSGFNISVEIPLTGGDTEVA